MKLFTKLAILLILSTNIFASSLKVTTFNVRWFGLGGELSGLRTDEYRSSFLKEFINKKLINTDIFVFQEIVNVEELSDMMGELGRHCISYRHEQFNHQKLVICLKKDLDIVTEKGDDDFAYDLVEDRPFLRPAIYGKVIDRYSKKPLIHLVGLHLKAAPNSSDLRIKQIETISERIKSYRSRGLPVVLVGDLNVYSSSQNGKTKSDIELIDTELEKIGLKRRTSELVNTYRTYSSRQSFDHAYVSSNTEVRYVEVWKACTASGRNLKRMDNIGWFNRFISDHCPVSMRVYLK